jgi:hypothetical protein
MTPAAWVDDLARDLPRAVARGFTHVALDARVERPVSDLEALADAGVVVAAVKLRGDLTLADVEARREQLRLLQRQVADAAVLGATLAWLPRAGSVSDGQPEPSLTLPALEDEARALLAEYAAARQVRLVEGLDVVPV